jgi:hypothetical protein
VEDDGNASAGFAQDSKHAKETAGKASRRPRQVGVLQQNPPITQGFRLEVKRI